MKEYTVPEQTVKRLPLYLRRSEELAERGKESVTSEKFVKDLPGINSNNLRKDLSYFGNYGKKGSGYDIPKLNSELRKILKLNTDTAVALVGVGNLGTALLTHQDFNRWGFTVSLAFDKDPKIVESRVGGIVVDPVEELPSKVRDRGIEVAMIAVPAESAQTVADKLTSVGIKGILNFAPVLLEVPENITVKQVDITSRLKELSYHLKG